MLYSILKYFYFTALLFLIISAPTLNAQNKDIIYETVQTNTLTSTGSVVGFQTQNLYAFATPYLKAFSLKTKGLVDFEIKSLVENDKFSLPFLDQSRRYIYGVFLDKNNNGLLDLSSEAFYFAQTLNGQLVVDKSNSRSINLKVLNADDSKDIGVRVFDFEGKLLFTRQFSSSKIYLQHLPIKSSFKLYNTGPMEDHPISLTEAGIHYNISPYPKNDFVATFGLPWSPLNLDIQYDDSKYYLTLTSTSKNSVTTLNVFDLYDVPHDQYRISMRNTTTNEKVLDAPAFHHPSKRLLSFEFSDKYFVEFQENVKQKKCKIFQNGDILYQGGNPLKLALLQKGEYTIHLYDKVKRAIRKKNKHLLKNFETFHFTLNKDNPSIQITSLLPKFKKTELSIQLFNQKTKTKNEGQLIVFHRKDNDLNSNLIHISSLDKTTSTGLLKLDVKVNPKQILFLHFDFNSNFVIDKAEEEYVRGFQWEDLNKLLSVPHVKEGFLELSAKTSQSNPYFVRVTNTVDGSILVSNYISNKVVSYQNLPLEIDLKIEVIYDSNGDEVPDEGDVHFPPVYTRIRANTQIEKLVMDLNE